MKKFRKLLCMLVAVVTLSSVITANACTCVAVGKDASVDGSTMVAHTCDGRYDNRLEIIPGGTHAEGEVVEIYRDPCMDSIYPVSKVGEIPQVAETYTYVDIGYPFLNEKGLTISEHTWSGDYANFYNGEAAMMVIANLGALGLQRASTARECVQVMGEIAEKYGYADGGECLIISDGEEVWVFEVAGPGPLWTPDSGKPGAHWAARRVADDEVWGGANRSTLGIIDFNDPENYMWSTDITAYPKELGMWQEGEPFDYTVIFDTVEGNTAYTCSARVWRIFDLVAPSIEMEIPNGEEAANEETFPFSVKPDEKVSVQFIMDVIYRDHYEGTAFDATTTVDAGPFHSPVRYSVARGEAREEVASWSWPRTIAVKQCSYAFVAQNRGWMPAEIGTVLWFGLDSPDTTVYVPMYAGTTEVPVEWYTSDRYNFDFNSAWWAFNFVNNWANLRWDAMFADISAKRAEIMDATYAKQAEIEKEALALYEAGDVDGAKAVLTKFSCETMDSTLEQWWQFAAELVAKYHDGNCLTADGNKTLGYGEDWMQNYSEYGLDQLAENQKYLERIGAVTEEPAEEPEEPAEEPEEPAEEPEEPAETPVEPSEPDVNTETNNNTALIIGVVAVIVVAAAAFFFLKKKKN